MSKIKTKIVCTIGPSSDSIEILQNLKEHGMTFARINMSHADLNYLEEKLKILSDLNINVILDLQGAEIRTGITKDATFLEKDKLVQLVDNSCIGSSSSVSFRTSWVLNQLKKDQILNIDDGSIQLRVTKPFSLQNQFAEGIVIVPGKLGNFKTVSINADLNAPVLSELDLKAVRLAMRFGVRYVALSFVKNHKDIQQLRNICGGKMNIISKIEHRESLNDLENIIKESDSILIDRGDLGAEIPLEKIPLTQKIIIKKCRALGKEVFVATHFLDSMVWKPTPTRAELNDVINTVIDGATGLVLAKETAAGMYPVDALKMMVNLCRNAELVSESFNESSQKQLSANEQIINVLDKLNYLE
ncbi:MAG: pyruvate kinase [Candidatus Diapherotrites archaeon]